ncbi:hypothetical protein LZT09_10615 [Vibrio fluvialis]|uniref:hypothetical protein n=1 Tax=Vibrio fluvialis TaxID=676 RepID=UPI001C9BC398|nr:hypothetical protein [Vibrio fluvialis]EKO3514159.1 hypothetical protein [Vibrio fluvialis]EKO3910268.1 hypothetical protein [Vibrio fluvialis]ELX7502617.1 hypothetical protein [Vibrio fluvialis]MBY8128086.1 hypothetical protein [Vibrio fluvialis]MBY8212913.1 hypothetical protein [Vibrio fluvialis]
MKLNKQEQKAIDDMQKVLDTLKKPTGDVCLSSGDIANIQRVLGIDLWKSTLGRKEVKETVRSKELPRLFISFRTGGGAYEAAKHCFFPFQVKTRA